jgi:hypothetical protein
MTLVLFGENLTQQLDFLASIRMELMKYNNIVGHEIRHQYQSSVQ